MNAAQIHLALNHAPLFLSIIGGGILILGMIKKNESFKTISLYMLVAAAIFTVPVYLTGEGTEELVEHLPGVNEATIEKHEEMAKISLIIIIITGAIALIGLLLRKNAAVAKLAFVGAIFLSLASFGTMAQTAHLGGLIRHSELQAGAAAAEGGDEKEGEENEEGEKKVSDSLRQGQRMVKDSLKVAEKDEKKKEDDD
ncbi:MAG: DUF2231 domain-containing protein [Chitinophagaceae bacterium]